jgi:hypothetical protein
MSISASTALIILVFFIVLFVGCYAAYLRAYLGVRDHGRGQAMRVVSASVPASVLAQYEGSGIDGDDDGDQ